MLRFVTLLLFIFLAFSFDVKAGVNVAIVAPQVGPYEKFGKELIDGAKIAVDDINDNGGLLGKYVNLIVIDDLCDDVLSLSTAQMLSVNSSKEDKLSLIIGPYCSNSFESIANLYAKAKIFQIVPTTITSNILDSEHEGLIKMMGGVERQGEDFFSYYQDNFATKKVAIIYDSDERKAVDIAVTVQKKFRENESLERLISFDLNKYKMPKDIAKKILDSGAEMAYIVGGSENSHEVFKELKNRKKYFLIFVNRYQMTGDFEKSLGNLAEGSYAVSLPSLKDSPAFTEQLVKFRLQGIEPEGLSLYSYSAVKLWEDMVTKTKSFDYEDLSKVSKDDKFETIWGDVMFNKGSPKDVLNYSIYQIQSGQYNQVY